MLQITHTRDCGDAVLHNAPSSLARYSLDPSHTLARSHDMMSPSVAVLSYAARPSVRRPRLGLPGGDTVVGGTENAKLFFVHRRKGPRLLLPFRSLHPPKHRSILC